MKYSYLGMSLELTVTGLCSITIPMLIFDALKDIESGVVANPASVTLLIIEENSPLLDEAPRKRLHSKATQENQVRYPDCSCIPDN